MSISQEQGGILGGKTVTDTDLDPTAKAVYSLIPVFVGRQNDAARSVGLKLIKGGSRIIAGVATILSGNSSVTVTIGQTLPGTEYVVLATMHNVGSQGVQFTNRTTTQFTLSLGGAVGADQEISWMVIF